MQEIEILQVSHVQPRENTSSIYINDALCLENSVHIDNTDYIGALEFMDINNIKLVSYYKYTEFKINNIDVLQVCDNKYIYELEIDSKCDIISNFESNVDIECLLDDILNKNIVTQELVIINYLRPFAKMKIKFILNKYNLPDTFYLKYKCYLLDNKRRLDLSREKIHTDTHVYHKGCVIDRDYVPDNFIS